MSHSLKTIGIAGAGTMGAGIAQVCSQAGYQVVLFDLQKAVLDKASASITASLNKLEASGKLSVDSKQKALSAIQFTDSISELKADLIIEAIIEKLDAKVGLFEQLMEINGDSCIYATNTSSIPVTKIAAPLKYADKVLGIHFFNPAQIMKLVEIIKGAKTNDDVLKISGDFVLSLNKVPVFAADAPGFIVNRIARLYYVEALKMVEEGVADFETIDKIMESSGFKMGPFRLMDLRSEEHTSELQSHHD